jgi:alcohol dehydrogenase
MAYRFYVNSDIVFGRDSVKELPGILKGYGAKKVMVVYDAGVKAAGIAEQVLAMVEETSIPYVVFDGVIPNPTNEVVEEAAGWPGVMEWTHLLQWAEEAVLTWLRPLMC